MFIAGDIGGTKTVVALFEESGGSLALVRDDTFKSKDHKSLEEILGKFLKGEKLNGHVSYERVLSGPGYMNVYEFLRDKGYYPETPSLREKLKTSEVPSATITQLGLTGEDALCVATNDLFSAIYGAESGNLALKCVAVGGVFVGGGIAPKMLKALQKGSFLEGFLDKGRFANLMKSLPVF